MGAVAVAVVAKAQAHAGRCTARAQAPDRPAPRSTSPHLHLRNTAASSTSLAQRSARSRSLSPDAYRRSWRNLGNCSSQAGSSIRPPLHSQEAMLASATTPAQPHRRTERSRRSSSSFEYRPPRCQLCAFVLVRGDRQPVCRTLGASANHLPHRHAQQGRICQGST